MASKGPRKANGGLTFPKRNRISCVVVFQYAMICFHARGRREAILPNTIYGFAAVERTKA